VTILVAGAPGMIYAIRTWSVSSRVDLIQDRQDDVRDRLARVETKYDALLINFDDQKEEIHRLQAQLDASTRGK
jgi:hypothetical protein